MSQMKDKLIQGYKVTTIKIGQGSFGSVFLGSTPEGQQIAVKVINRDSHTGRSISHIENQILALKNCRNEHIIKFVDVKKTSSAYYLFLEYCGDGSLKKMIGEKGRLGEREAMRLFYQIVEGFKSIVKKGIIHRDIKPENILLKDGKIKISDFGISRLMSKNNMALTFAGSPLNMAPQILKGDLYDNKVDIYSLGTVLYEMLFGCSPYVGSTTFDLLQSIQLKQLNQYDLTLISKQTQDLLNKLLKQNPRQRMSWDQLFNYQTNINKKQSRKVSPYARILARMSPRNICTIPSLFCLMNEQMNKENDSKECNNDVTCFMDLSLCVNLFTNLVKCTEIEE